MIFGRHRVRANFYHFVSVVFLITTALWFIGIVPDNISTIIGMVLFTVDYISEMYDPHPDTPGPWFKAHFHRFLEDDTETPWDEADYDEIVIRIPK